MADIKRGDLLLIYFSCHGIKDVNGQLYFAMVDTRLNQLDSTAISANFVNDMMSRSPSDQQVLYHLAYVFKPPLTDSFSY